MVTLFFSLKKKDIPQQDTDANFIFLIVFKSKKISRRELSFAYIEQKHSLFSTQQEPQPEVCETVSICSFVAL